MTFLPADVMESQLSMIDLLIAMFPSPSELEIPESTKEALIKLHDWCQDPTKVLTGIPSSLSLAVYLAIATDKSIQVNISISVSQSENLGINESLPISYSLRQPEWMSKAEVASIAATMPSDDVFAAFEYIREEAMHLLQKRESLTEVIATRSTGPLVRVWFYFPSLSTRGKRNDLVNYASDYSLTGFVLAGKPGVLCLEGQSTDIDAYMSFIKINSWGDIPSHQKKVSERFREMADIRRVFTEMEEITDSLGERSGQRANRGDMQALEAWLAARGLREAFEKVIF
ncbi:DUF1115 domain protein [Talaromyces pinophilus]|uniref:DUF1115 domain protein n=1 Tax=Talaromyces pinophilus TaxID=128442 RepID=A0A510NXM2_TALPI|nr:hypothetical protein PENOC_049630 [Penicillium occitanis (nom. inval.)]PCH02568.1 Uncharacterized conserved protein UCP038021, RWD [Penicillium occitanis (nom. inval.)]GAM36814.1 DUF1115 domain protein [Talaromyces pinophilus]